MNETTLRRALAGARPELEAGLAEAELELRALEQRRNELTALIAQAKAALGLASGAGPHRLGNGRALTLHDAIAQILRERGNAWMTVRDILRELNERGLYHKRDGSLVELNQIHARTKNYGHMFEKDGAKLRLKNP